jgi:NodT family efflux transporter outer membrane factor (OMF) lipoprotein
LIEEETMIKPYMKEPFQIIVLAAVAILWVGCAVGPNFHKPNPSASQTYVSDTQPSETMEAKGPGGNAQRFNTGMDIPAQWWSLFHSDSLDRLVRLALDDSPTLMQAQAKLKQAQEDFNAQTGATQYPAVDARLSITRQQVDLVSYGISNFPNPGPFTLYNASVSASYTLDLFGGNRRALEGLKAKVDYQVFELEAARQTLVANVVSTAIKQASLRAKIDIVQNLMDAQSQQMAITEERYKAGGVSVLDVQNQSILLDQTKALLPPLKKQLAQVNDQLAVYLGREPAEVKIDKFDLNSLHLPEELPLSLPSSLARQRPDIRAAEALWHQASANVGVATANLFPQITLSGSFGSQRISAGDILSGVNIWNIAGNLMQPIFHGGELWAKKRSAVAAYDEAAAAYRQTALKGLQEVADTLHALDADARTLQAMTDTTDHARTGYEIAQRQYQLGGISHLALLDAQRQLLQTEMDRVQAQADRYADTAALLYALGGGWWKPLSENVPVDSTSTTEIQK